MNRKMSALMALVLVTVLSGGCSKKSKVPESMSSVPADADVVGTLDAKAIVAYAKKTLPKFVPAEMKDKIPSIEKMAEQLLKMSGVDLDKIGQVTFIGYAGSGDKMAFIVEGVDAKAIKGEKKDEHNGVEIFQIPNAIFYAEIKGHGVVGAPNPEMIKKILDAKAGKGKRLADSDRSKIFSELAGVEDDLSQLRFYVLTGKFPGVPPSPVKIKGGGFFMHIDKGIAGAVLSDDEGAKQFKQQLDMGLMGVKMAMSMPEGGDMGLPMELDKETKKMIGDLLNKIETDQSGNSVSVVYHGDLKPLIEKAVAMGIEQAKGGFDSAIAEPVPAVPEVEAKPAEPPKPEAPETPEPEAVKKAAE